MKDELVLLQGAAHLHLITWALAEAASDALGGEEEGQSSGVSLWMAVGDGGYRPAGSGLAEGHLRPYRCGPGSSGLCP